MTEWIDQLKEKIIHLEVSTTVVPIFIRTATFSNNILGGKSPEERTNRGVHSSE